MREGRGGGESLFFDCWACDGRGICLVDCDGLFVIEGADLSAWGFGGLGRGSHDTVSCELSLDEVRACKFTLRCKVPFAFFLLFSPFSFDLMAPVNIALLINYTSMASYEINLYVVLATNPLLVEKSIDLILLRQPSISPTPDFFKTYPLTSIGTPSNNNLSMPKTGHRPSHDGSSLSGKTG